MNHQEFVTNEKSLLIAPAGFGKTHTITECLQYTLGRQLILTHTHAGVASIQQKIKKAQIDPSKYAVETITSFAQKYVRGLYAKDDTPEQENGVEYYPFIIKRAAELILLKPVAAVIRFSYSGLFVDEYQDCTTAHHELILALAKILPTRLLGDPLQGIFGFNGENLIDLTNKAEMGVFSDYIYQLTVPWRWKHVNEPLGEDLKTIRTKLLTSQPLNLRDYPSIRVVQAPEADIYDARKDYNQIIKRLLNEESLLLIHPESHNINGRKKVIGSLNYARTLVEAIDDKDFYRLAKIFDTATSLTLEKIIRDVCCSIFKKGVCDTWFNENGFKRKSGTDAVTIAPIIELLAQAKNSISFIVISKLLRAINKLPGMRSYRRELFSSLLKALEGATVNNISVYESMVAKRNQTRRIGRKIIGRCIGTTLLTKGLEFDTVVVLNAHKFTSPKDLYVALTRGSKRLIVFTQNTTLTPVY